MEGCVIALACWLLSVSVTGTTARRESAQVLSMDRLMALQHPDRFVNLKPLSLATCEAHCKMALQA